MLSRLDDFGAGDSRLFRFRQRVLPDWIDGNRHMNAAYYLSAIKDAAIQVHKDWDYSDEFRARTGESNFVREAHVVYVRELLADDSIVVTARITDVQERTMTMLFELFNEERNYLAALVEYVLVHVTLGPPPSSKAIPPGLRSRLEAQRDRDAAVPLPSAARRLPSRHDEPTHRRDRAQATFES
jgi:acyl-CoA thioester hydrolase